MKLYEAYASKTWKTGFVLETHDEKYKPVILHPHIYNLKKRTWKKRDFLPWEIFPTLSKKASGFLGTFKTLAEAKERVEETFNQTSVKEAIAL